METLTLEGKTVSIDTENLSKGLCKIHNDIPAKKAALSIGMLDAELCEYMLDSITERVINEFGNERYKVYELSIKDFCKSCMRIIEKGVYSHAEMVV